MSETDEPISDNGALRDRMARLGRAILRVNASLDVATVLQEIVDSARALTGARYSVIATVGDAGDAQDFVISGFTPDEERELANWPEGPQLFEQLQDLPKPLRLSNLSALVRTLGFSTDLMHADSFLGMPMRNRGAHVGNFFLAGKEGAAEFTADDEEVLVLFASQAAAAVANARTYRDEQRARADLEALIDTSPVGVVVFDAKTGNPQSFNREARRIVESLRTPGGSPEQILEVLTCRRADGREIRLDEIPLSEQLTSSETIRSEEMVLSVPDGRSVATLVNVTPILADDGAAATVVVTMQDLAPFEELERLRAEFLTMVSHELRAPLASIKGSTATVLGARPPPASAEMLQFFRIIDEQADHMRGLIANLLDAGSIEAGTLTVAPEPSDVTSLVDQSRNTFLSSDSRHTVVIDLPPNLPRILADRQRIVQILNNLLSNAARHSPESSPIRVDAVRDGVHVAISVSDRGRGITPEQLPHLFRKHAGIAGGNGEPRANATGLGLAICKGLVEAHGGRIWAESAGTDQGARFTFTIPVVEEAGAAPDSARIDARPARARSGGEPTRILVVDDDPLALRFVRDALAAAGYTPLVTGDPEELAYLIRTEKPKLVLLDLVLPGTDGIALMERIPELADLPVIFISGYGRDETIARALETGAADYIVKPFSPTELTARIRAALRRETEPDPFVLGDLVIRYEQRRVTVADRQVRLTATEYEILKVLSLDAGRVVTNETLVRRVWGEQDAGESDRVRTFVKNLRRKLGDSAARPVWIFNERGVGYRMAGPDKP